MSRQANLRYASLRFVYYVAAVPRIPRQRQLRPPTPRDRPVGSAVARSKYCVMNPCCLLCPSYAADSWSVYLAPFHFRLGVKSIWRGCVATSAPKIVSYSLVFFGQFVDDGLVERRQVFGCSRGYEIAIDDKLFIGPVCASVAQIGLEAGVAGHIAVFDHIGFGENPGSVTD